MFRSFFIVQDMEHNSRIVYMMVLFILLSVFLQNYGFLGFMRLKVLIFM